MTGQEIFVFLVMMIFISITISAAIQRTNKKDKSEDEWDDIKRELEYRLSDLDAKIINSRDEPEKIYYTTSEYGMDQVYTSYVEEERCAWCGNRLVLDDKGRCASCGASG